MNSSPSNEILGMITSKFEIEFLFAVAAKQCTIMANSKVYLPAG